ncbi:metal-dependent hydrolase [Thermococcus sp. Bubb.Bath]|uniref:metal-dependent hydrolase n=1 Tax=Thermococcus sp. Bubb.Bath TaxID=1638242 RepID=UPI00143B69E2|nr:metal-dependent hydrolase [Thermococcus sp. Bubb.Bath]NJF25256.1 metal-dependent hydrolase [Thermococcus sp. Bubb.Bath]
MNPFEHASIPTLAYLALAHSPNLISALILMIGAVFPDLDALAKEHRSYLHSLLVFAPFMLLGWIVGGYPLLFVLGWASHLFLDFFTGVIPPIYPLSRRGWGLSLRLWGGVSSVHFGVEVIERYPEPRREYRLDVGGGFAMFLIALFVLIARCTNL